ncbi:MAG TPA: hypothetical protein VGD69_01800 [Herpetosiphonaceae bacterium]
MPNVEVLALESAPVRLPPCLFDRVLENLVVNSAEAGAKNILIVVS